VPINTITYRMRSCCVSEEFAANMFWALSNPPQKLTPEQRHTLSWEAAMERYVMYGATVW
jgi:hypothetical protein